VKQLTTRKGPDGNPVVSPDGRLVAYTGFDWTDDTWRDAALYVMNADGSSPRALTTSLDRSPMQLEWAADGSGIYFTIEDKGSRNLWFAPLRGEPRAITSGTHMLSVGDMGKDGLIVGTRSSFQEPGDIVSFTCARPTSCAS
jgi:Tol biopolymer transport system component